MEAAKKLTIPIREPLVHLSEWKKPACYTHHRREIHQQTLISSLDPILAGATKQSDLLENMQIMHSLASTCRGISRILITSILFLLLIAKAPFRAKIKLTTSTKTTRKIKWKKKKKHYVQLPSWGTRPIETCSHNFLVYNPFGFSLLAYLFACWRKQRDYKRERGGRKEKKRKGGREGGREGRGRHKVLP